VSTATPPPASSSPPPPHAAPVPATIAAFDFDGTLTRGGSVFPFLVAVRGLLPVLAASVREFPMLVRAALVGGATADRAKEAVFTRLLSGVEESRVNRVGATFAQQHLQRHLRPEVKARLDWHRSQGHAVVIVSASPECYLRPASEALGADGVLATRLASSGGILTGRYEGKNCRGAEKYARVVAWLRANGQSGNGLPQPVLWAYGNSRGDLRLLDAADHGVDAGRLGPLGRLRHFPALQSLPESSVEPAGPAGGRATPG
jgi:phosphatidylglycerophosphatase C